MTDAIADVWRFRRRPVLIVAGMLVSLVVLMLGLAAVIHATHRPVAATQRPSAEASAPTSAASVATPSEAPASDVASWDAVPAIAPATSTAYPPIAAAARQEPSAYAAAFAQELFTRDYRVDRQQLLAWAQSEDSPLQSPNYPKSDWSKFLVDSLTDLTWDDAIATPIPAEGLWLTLSAERAQDVVSDIKVSIDPLWEKQIAGGYQPPDPLATARDVTLTVTRHDAADPVSTKRFAVSLILQLGAGPSGGYGVAATNDYVVKEMS